MPKCDFNILLCNFFEITLQHGCSPVNLLHIFRTPFLLEHAWTTASIHLYCEYRDTFRTLRNINVTVLFRKKICKQFLEKNSIIRFCLYLCYYISILIFVLRGRVTEFQYAWLYVPEPLTIFFFDDSSRHKT